MEYLALLRRSLSLFKGASRWLKGWTIQTIGFQNMLLPPMEEETTLMWNAERLSEKRNAPHDRSRDLAPPMAGSRKRGANALIG